MLSLERHLADLEHALDTLRQARSTDLDAGQAAEIGAVLVRSAGKVCALFVQEALARLAGRPDLVPVGHGGRPPADPPSPTGEDAAVERRFADERGSRL